MNFLMTRVFQEAGLREDSLNALEDKLTAKKFEPGEHLIRQGDAAPYLFMVRTGLVKMFYVTAEGKEFVKSFLPEGSIAGSLSALLKGHPSRFSMTCLEPVEAELVSFKVMQDVFETDIAAMKFGFTFFQNMALRKEEREHDFLCLNPEDRYRGFVEENPELVQRITQADIARYLGITPVALSRIRKRMKD